MPELGEPLDECESCGEDLYNGVPHECPVSGAIVLVTFVEER
jgi:hypothetical protein